MIGGFLVEYSRKNGFLEPYSGSTKVICSQEKLIELLQKKYTYAVWRCTFINVDKYLENHPDENIEVWE